MNPLLAKASQASSDFIWDAIVSHLPGKVKRSRTNYLNFNCPMCVLEGETADTKGRCGVSRTGNDNIRIGCFNCGFSTAYILGRLLFSGMRAFLVQLGMEEIDINRLNFRASEISQLMVNTGMQEPMNPVFSVSFDEVKLPEDCYPITQWAELGLDEPDFLEAAAYAITRGGNVAEKAHWSPEEKWKNRIIFPCMFKGKIVGWTARAVHDTEEAKYLNEVPANYLSNCDVMNDYERQYLLLTEGYLDAEAVDGISPFGAKLSPRQAQWIKECGKQVIVIPDRDKSGQRLIDVAIANDWSVAFPRLTRGGNNWWAEDCKDCADAVKKYGRLYTLRSILETATTSKLEIEVRRKWLYEG